MSKSKYFIYEDCGYEGEEVYMVVDTEDEAKEYLEKINKISDYNCMYKQIENAPCFYCEYLIKDNGEERFRCFITQCPDPEYLSKVQSLTIYKEVVFYIVQDLTNIDPIEFKNQLKELGKRLRELLIANPGKTIKLDENRNPIIV